MTDTLPDVYSVGQRRRPGGSFPPSGGGGGGAGGTGAPNQNELGEVQPEDPQPHPCDNPESARDWNADAAAAEALRRMKRFAMLAHGEDSFANREYGTLLCERSDGAIVIGGMYSGDPVMDENGHPTGLSPQVDVPFEGCGAGTNILAMAHSHVSGSGAPSGPDITWLPAINGARNDMNGRIYVVSYDGSSDRIHVYNRTNAEDAFATGNLGPEVNPVAEPCPGYQVI